MYYGTINCDCGQEFYFETINTKIKCIHCSKEYDVKDYPIMEEEDITSGSMPDEPGD